MFDPVELAKTAVTTYMSTGKIPMVPSDIPARWLQPGAAFVCIKKDGQLRGCIGTYMPTRASLAEEIIHNAVGSATNDPRFLPVSREELAGLEFSIDILEPPEKVYTADDLDPKVFGVMVRAGGRLGLLLPDLEGVDTVEKQVAIAKQKAGIFPGEAAELFRFRVRRFARTYVGTDASPDEE